MSFLLDEDHALKESLKGLTVVDNKNSSRPVGVWFGQPDMEIRDQSYPYITIDLVDVSEAVERQMRALMVEYAYPPSGYDPSFRWGGELGTPVNLDYQVTSYARQPQHDRQIISQLLNGPLPMRAGLLHIPADGSTRRLDFLGFAKRDTTENAKRLFVNTFRVRVSSELPPATLVKLYEVGDVHITLNQLSLTIPTNP